MPPRPSRRTDACAAGDIGSQNAACEAAVACTPAPAGATATTTDRGNERDRAGQLSLPHVTPPSCYGGPPATVHRHCRRKLYRVSAPLDAHAGGHNPAPCPTSATPSSSPTTRRGRRAACGAGRPGAGRGDPPRAQRRRRRDALPRPGRGGRPDRARRHRRGRRARLEPRAGGRRRRAVCVVHEDSELEPGCARRLLDTLRERPEPPPRARARTRPAARRPITAGSSGPTGRRASCTSPTATHLRRRLRIVVVPDARPRRRSASAASTSGSSPPSTWTPP